MPEAWRIVKARHAATAFSGEGAQKSGGRWNSRGIAVALPRTVPKRHARKRVSVPRTKCPSLSLGLKGVLGATPAFCKSNAVSPAKATNPARRQFDRFLSNECQSVESAKRRLSSR